MWAILLALLVSTHAGCVIPLLVPKAYHVEYRPERIVDPDAFSPSSAKSESTESLGADARVVLVTYHDRGNVGLEAQYEFLGAEAVRGTPTEIHYPLRFYWHVVVVGMLAAGYPQYPGAIAFHEGHWPTIAGQNAAASAVDYDAPTRRQWDCWVIRLRFYPKATSYDRWVSQGAGFDGDRGVSLDTILKSHLPQLVRVIEKSRKITDADRAMVLEQLREVIECERQRLKDAGTLSDQKAAVYEKALNRLQEAYSRTAEAQ